MVETFIMGLFIIGICVIFMVFGIIEWFWNFITETDEQARYWRKVHDDKMTREIKRNIRLTRHLT